MKEYKKPLIKTVTLGCVLFFVLMGVIISIGVYKIYTRTMYDRYKAQMDAIVTYAASFVDNDDMSECAETLVESEKYKETQEAFDKIVDNYADMHYLYMYTVVEIDGNYRVIELCCGNSTYEKEHTPENVLHLGDFDDEWYDESIEKKMYEIQYGDEDVYFLEPSAWGMDYTLARPMVDSAGNHFGALCVDVGIDEIQHTIYRNIAIMIGVIFGLAVLFIVLLIKWMHHYIIRPIKRLEDSVVEFAESSQGKLDPDELIYNAPDIHTENEVEALKDAVEKLSVDMREYIKNYVSAESRANDLEVHVSEMSDIAYHDALTSVENKAAYNQKVAILNEEIKMGKACFAIVMIDLNGLKKINDSFGHDYGDRYIIGGCGIIESVYEKSPVYRIGGDEFVVILEGEDYENRFHLIGEVRERFKEAYLDDEVDQWRRFSGAVGMADYTPGEDENVETVFRQADKKMYDAKLTMKSFTR